MFVFFKYNHHNTLKANYRSVKAAHIQYVATLYSLGQLRPQVLYFIYIHALLFRDLVAVILGLFGCCMKKLPEFLISMPTRILL